MPGIHRDRAIGLAGPIGGQVSQQRIGGGVEQGEAALVRRRVGLLRMSGERQQPGGQHQTTRQCVQTSLAFALIVRCCPSPSVSR
jgi:hypothetical protein